MINRPCVIAHRGYSQIAPENTVPAFKAAARAGADLVELDYRHSCDGVPVAIHDATLDRTTNAGAKWGSTGIAVGKTSLERLRDLDAGSWFDPLYSNTGVPTLTSALEVIRGESVALIEQKSGDAATLVKLLNQANLATEVMVQSFDWDFLKRVNELNPGIALGALGPPSRFDGDPLPPEERRLSCRFLDALPEIGCRVVVWSQDVDEEAIEAARQRSVKVWVYTINRPSAAVYWLACGVDGLITDNPARIWKAIALRHFK